MCLYIIIIFYSLQGLFISDLTMNDENWKEELKEWNPKLKPYQLKLLDQGPKSNSQILTLSDMWLEWKDLLVERELKEIAEDTMIADQEEEDLESCKLKPNCIDDQFLKFVQPLN